MKTIKIFILALLTICSNSFATDLVQIYRESLISDPVFQQAFATYKASSEAIPQAWATLLPQMGLTGNTGYTRFISPINQPPITVNGETFVTPSTSTSYEFWTYNLTLSQAVFNFQAWENVKLARASVKQAQAVFNFSAQDLISRVAAAYFGVLEAKDHLRFTQAEKRANKRQLDQATQRYKVGLDAITSVYEAQASYDSAIAQEIADKNTVVNRYEDLRRLTNRTYTSLATLDTERLPLIKPKPSNVDCWVETSLRQNYNYIAARYALDAARENIRVKAGGNWPTVAFQANYQRYGSTTGGTSIQQQIGTTETAQLALNFPAYQGGLIVSQTRQAKDNYEFAAQKLEQTYRETIVNTKVAYNNVVSGLSKIKADREAVVSAANSESSTEAQFNVGTRTMVDVLTEQQKLYQAQTQLATDQYAYILAIVALKQAAGTLSAQDIFVINNWLEGTHHFARPHHKQAPKTTAGADTTAVSVTPVLPAATSPLPVTPPIPVVATPKSSSVVIPVAPEPSNIPAIPKTSLNSSRNHPTFRRTRAASKIPSISLVSVYKLLRTN